MTLCLDVGNSQIYGGIYKKHVLIFKFRKASKVGDSSDEIGIFLVNVLRENSITPTAISDISICTVVPESLYSLNNACRKYFSITPFILKAGVKTGLKICYKNPLEVGTDRIANAISASNTFPQKNLVIVDMGTAITFCAISKAKEYLGGTIMPGLNVAMQSLVDKTSKLPAVEILRTRSAIGTSTVSSIQCGLFHSVLGTAKHLSKKISEECFSGERPLIIGTGGFTHLFQKENIFDHIRANLVLEGLLIALRMNRSKWSAPHTQKPDALA